MSSGWWTIWNHDADPIDQHVTTPAAPKGARSLQAGSGVGPGATSMYRVERSELSRRGNRHPARAALAYLARRCTAATNTELADLLGLSCAESVPNLTGRFSAWVSV